MTALRWSHTKEQRSKDDQDKEDMNTGDQPEGVWGGGGGMGQ